MGSIGRTLTATLGAAATALFGMSISAGPPAAVANQQVPVPERFHGVVLQDTTTNADFNLMEQGGVASLRMPLSWHRIEQSEGRYDWSHPDRLIGAASARGIRVLPFAYGTPSWLKPTPSNPPVDARGKSAFQRFLAEAVRRYGPGGRFWLTHHGDPVKTWQIWNEVNLDAYWKPEPDPAAYGEMFQAAERTIHAIDRRAKIVLSGMAPTPSSIPPRTYLEALLSNPATDAAVDAVALHPYGNSVRFVKKKIKQAREAMRVVGTKHEIWITEVGWGSGGPPSPFSADTPSGQAERLTHLYDKLAEKRRRWKLKRVYWFAWKDASDTGSHCRFCPFSGLFTHGGKAKPAWQAFRDSAARLRSKRATQQQDR